MAVALEQVDDVGVEACEVHGGVEHRLLFLAGDDVGTDARHELLAETHGEDCVEIAEEAQELLGRAKARGQVPDMAGIEPHGRIVEPDAADQPAEMAVGNQETGLQRSRISSSQMMWREASMSCVRFSATAGVPATPA